MISVMTDSDHMDENREGDPAEDLELTDEQADSVQGGVNDIHFTKPVDKSSPKLSP